MVYNVLSLACTCITYAHHIHQCRTCLHKCHVFAFQSHYYIFGSCNMVEIFLHNYHCLLISWTNLDLIEFVLVFCTWFFAVYLFFCKCLAVPLMEKNP